VDSPRVGPQPGALAFDFRLGSAPADKAQIKVDNVSLTKGFGAWVNVPRSTPRTLELSGSILEHTPSDPVKPEWPFYKTKSITLRTGGWT
jgi:hypothetical protein